jgi:PAS domain S-box-containing protein
MGGVTLAILIFLLVSSISLLLWLLKAKVDQKALQLLYEKSPNPLAFISLPDCEFLQYNARFRNTFGDHAESIQKKFSSHIPQIREAFSKLHVDDISALHLGIIEINSINNERLFFKTTISLANHRNNTRGILWLTDVTKHVEHESQLTSLKEKLEEEVRIRTDDLNSAYQELLTSNEELLALNEASYLTNNSLQEANDKLTEIQQELHLKNVTLQAQSEEKLNKILSSIREVVWNGHVIGDSVYIDFVNDAFTLMTGISIEQALGMKIPKEHVVPELYQLLLSDKIKTTGVYEIESEVKSVNTVSGNITWIFHRCWVRVDAEKGDIRIDGTMSDISSQKFAQEEAEAQQQMLKGLVDNIPMMISLIDKDGTVSYASKNFYFPSTPEIKLMDFIGKPLKDFEDLTSVSDYHRAWLNVYRKNERKWIHYDGTDQFGKQFHFDWFGLTLADGSRIEIGRDVTDTFQLEMELVEKTEQLQVIVENLPQFIILSDKDGNCLFCNDRFTQFYNHHVSSEINLQDTVVTEAQLFSTLYQDQPIQHKQQVTHMLSGYGNHVEVPFTNKHQNTFYIEWNRVLLPGDGFMTIGTDITANKNLLLDLEIQHKTMRTLINNLPLKFIFFDKNETIQFITENFPMDNVQSFIGKSLETFVRTVLDDKIKQDEALSIFRYSRGWTEFEAIAPMGKEIQDSWTTVELPDGGFITLGQDIRSQKKSEVEKNKLLKQLIVQNNDLLQFSYMASHNLRGPVASMLGLISLMEPTVTLEEQKELFEHVKQSVTHLDSVISDINRILQFKNTVLLRKEYVDLEVLVDQLLRDFDVVLQDPSIVVTTRIEVIKVHSLRSYLYSILHNLISNAIRFRDLNRPLHITIHVYSISEELFITVTDNGKGIDLSRFGEKIFRLYQRFDLEAPGKGLGLFMAKTQAEAMGGKLDVHSKLDEGSSFTLTIPLN